MGALALMGAPDGAAAADKTFSSGAMSYSGSVIVNTTCIITNAGKKPVTMSVVGIYTIGGSLPIVPVDYENCTSVPLAPNASCSFFGSAGVHGGGLAVVKGDTKNLRGRCKLSAASDAEGKTIESAEMR